MKAGMASLVVGFLFAIGLGVSGMTQPEKVMGFLNLFGEWDPSLIFVMGGAISVHALAYRLIKKRQSPLFSLKWHLPTKKELTPALILGSILFGVGWGLAGYCPGPAITSLASFQTEPLIFVVSMLIGMQVFKWTDKVLKLHK